MEHLCRDPDVQRERAVEYENHHVMRSRHHRLRSGRRVPTDLIIVARVA